MLPPQREDNPPPVTRRPVCVVENRLQDYGLRKENPDYDTTGPTCCEQGNPYNGHVRVNRSSDCPVRTWPLGQLRRGHQAAGKNTGGGEPPREDSSAPSSLMYVLLRGKGKLAQWESGGGKCHFRGLGHQYFFPLIKKNRTRGLRFHDPPATDTLHGSSEIKELLFSVLKL